MTTFFSTRDVTFDKVVHEERVSTTGFILAAKEFIEILDPFFNPLFIPLRAQYRRDLEYIMTSYNATKGLDYLDDMLRHEKNLPCNHVKCTHGTYGITRLARAFSFIHESFRLLVDDHLDSPVKLPDIFREAHAKTWAKHNDPLTNKIFQVAIGGCPSKAALVARMGGEANIDQVKIEATAYFLHFGRCKDIIGRYCEGHGFKI